MEKLVFIINQDLIGVPVTIQQNGGCETTFRKRCIASEKGIGVIIEFPSKTLGYILDILYRQGNIHKLKWIVLNRTQSKTEILEIPQIHPGTVH